MQYEIKNRRTGKTQFACEICDEFKEESESIKLGAAVLVAAKEKAYLSDADLSGAYLSDADLSGADLRGADLSGAYLRDADIGGKKLIGRRPIIQIGPIGSESRYFIAYLTDAGLMLKAGCFFGTRDEFLAKLEDTHGDNEHAEEYRAALLLIDAHARIWTPKEIKE